MSTPESLYGYPAFAPHHADEVEYEAFLRRHRSPNSISALLWWRRKFVEAYPEMERWLHAPLPERVGRLRGEDEKSKTCPASHDARAYLYFLVLRGRLRLDYEWLIAIRSLHLWQCVAFETGLPAAVDRLVEETSGLGYNRDYARQGLHCAIGRIYMRTGDPDVGSIGRAELDEYSAAVRAFGERPDLELYFGSEHSWRLARERYLQYAHLLGVVLYHRGRLVQPPHISRPRQSSFGADKPRMRAVIERYLETRRAQGARPDTIENLDLALRRFVFWLSKEHPEIESFAGVTRKDLLEYSSAIDGMVTVRAGLPLSPLTKRSFLSGLSVFFRDAAEWEWEDLPGRPLLAIGDIPKVPDRVPRYIPEDQLARLMEAVRSLPCPYQRAALLIARWSGARRDEIRRLAVDCLDSYPDGTPRLHIPVGKGKADRLVPINEEGAAALRALQANRKTAERGLRDEQTGEESRRLFVHHGKPYSPNYLFADSLAEACRIAGLVTADGRPTITAHRFRHTVGHQLAESGARMRTIMSVLGHASPGMSMVYAWISDPEVLRDYQKVLGPGAEIAGPAAEELRSGKLLQSEIDWLRSNFFKTELELGHCLRLPQEGPCECDLYLSCAKFVTTREYAPRLRARRKLELELVEDAVSRGWEREVERHRCTIRRIEQLLAELGEPLHETAAQ